MKPSAEMITIDVADEALARDAEKFRGMGDVEAALCQGLDNQFSREGFMRKPEVVAVDGEAQGFFCAPRNPLKRFQKTVNIEGLGENFKGAFAKEFGRSSCDA